MTGRYVVPLHGGEPALLGGKAANLGALFDAGFPVPPGVCLGTAAFRRALSSFLPAIQQITAGKNLRQPRIAGGVEKAIMNLLDGLAIAPEILAELSEHVLALAEPGTPLAVRSSATVEDQEAASRAGQFATVLGVAGEKALHAAVLTCWRSLFSPGALASWTGAGEPSAAEMAVLIQPLVAAECAGVSFSLDPVHPESGHMVINWARGLGAGVVEGTVQASTAWLFRDNLTVAKQRRVKQDTRVVFESASGIALAPVSEQARHTPCLPEPWLKRVAQFTLAAELFFGCPQDVEWAIAAGRLWILQSRPLTGLPEDGPLPPPFPVDWKDEEAGRFWNAISLYPNEVLLPLEQDYVNQINEAEREKRHRTGDDHIPQAKIANGRIYLTTFPSDLPPGDRRMRQAALRERDRHLQSEGKTIWDIEQPGVVTLIEYLRQFKAPGAGSVGLIQHLEDALGTFRYTWITHGIVWNSLEPFYKAYEAVAGKSGPEARRSAQALLQAGETAATRLVDGLYELAVTARPSPELRAMVNDPPQNVRERLIALAQSDSLVQRFLAQFDRLLEEYGEANGRGYGSEATICALTWREQPDELLRGATPFLDPRLPSPASVRQDAAAEKQSKIESIILSCEDKAAADHFLRQLAYANSHLAVMDDHNHFIDQLPVGLLRRAILAAADWLVADGQLTHRNAIFWLNFAEIFLLLEGRGPEDLALLIEGRRADHARWSALAAPPFIGLPDSRLPERPLDAPFPGEDTGEEMPDTGLIRGLGASAGVYRGQARVVQEMGLLPELERGQILVTVNTGPLWLPLFPLLGGLVLDEGAFGQHAAITAREYGLPAVIMTGDATRKIPDGAWITVDGSAGTIALE